MDKILLMSLGSRGDMEPFLALGEELREAGHEVAFCMPAQFEELAKEVAPDFYPMTKSFLELMDDPEVKQITGQIGSGWSRFKTIVRLLKSTKPLQQQLIRDQRAASDDFKPDNIIYHVKCVYPVLAALHHGQRIEILSPVPCLLHPVEHEPAIGFGKPRGKRWNQFTYNLSNRALIGQAILSYGNPVCTEWNWPPLQKKQVKNLLLKEVPVEYAISERLFPEPAYWPEHVRVTGFRERNKSKHWEPSNELLAFLERHPNPLYIGFGSMINGRPKEVGRILLEVTAELKQPVLLNSSWGGIEIDGPIPNHAFLVDDIPYDWLFSRVCAVVHHGGSGTTHSALRFDLKQLIIPHIADQFLWMRLVVKAGMGPEGFAIKDLTKNKLKSALKALVESTSV